jgi:hypothetical protein
MKKRILLFKSKGFKIKGSHPPHPHCKCAACNSYRMDPSKYWQIEFGPKKWTIKRKRGMWK